jgi:hypothetical protein
VSGQTPLGIRLADPTLPLTRTRINFFSRLPALINLHVVVKDSEWLIDLPETLPPLLARIRFSDAPNPARVVAVLTHDSRNHWLNGLSNILVSHKPDQSYLPDDSQDQSVSVQMYRHSPKYMLHKINALEDPMDYDVHRILQEWLERVQGGQGCWKEGTHISLLSGTGV